MRIRKAKSNVVEGDLTPMIDMTFQLIAFFMVVINFTEAEQDDRIRLPASELAKPPDGPLDDPIFLQLTREGDVIYSGELMSIAGLQPHLIAEAEFLESNDTPRSEATLIIRADVDVPTGKVQELIQACQQVRFEKFALRAKEDMSY